MRIRCLSVQQPWAWALVEGIKLVENRTWPTAHRGPLAIHASKGRGWIDSASPAEWRKKFAPHQYPDRFEFGTVIGVVDLIDCVPYGDLPKALAKHPFALADYICWIVERPRKLATPIPFKGNANLFYVDVPSAYVDAGTTE